MQLQANHNETQITVIVLLAAQHTKHNYQTQPGTDIACSPILETNGMVLALQHDVSTLQNQHWQPTDCTIQCTRTQVTVNATTTWHNRHCSWNPFLQHTSKHHCETCLILENSYLFLLGRQCLCAHVVYTVTEAALHKAVVHFQTAAHMKRMNVKKKNSSVSKSLFTRLNRYHTIRHCRGNKKGRGLDQFCKQK